MFETETVGPCLIRKLKWEGREAWPPGSPDPPVATTLGYCQLIKRLSIKVASKSLLLLTNTEKSSKSDG